ncbi:uncharacterized protein [Zea mays]|uniref:uncharacterized protein LOC115032971 n=1 Tax=Zea mays TaxID=4577 RepID=UPI001112FF7E|nr:uncharacterized protein LOC115032971 [Zea mays]XP_035816643.1 uncharacterized protein LOC115032971 isoform X2 [Zea mays]
MGLKRPTAGAGEAAAQTITLSMSAMWDTVRAAMREAEAAALEPTQSCVSAVAQSTSSATALPSLQKMEPWMEGAFLRRMEQRA